MSWLEHRMVVVSNRLPLTVEENNSGFRLDASSGGLEEPSRCIAEVIRCSVRRCDDERRKLTHRSSIDSRALYKALVRWILPR